MTPILRTRKNSQVVLAAGLGILAVAAHAPVAAAQNNPGGVARSGMGQGSPSITTRSDVQLALESGPGTNKDRLEALGEAAKQKMNAIRACYANVVESRPTMVGAMRVQFEVAAKQKRPSVSVSKDTLGDSKLNQCIVKALLSVRVAPDSRPSAAVLSLNFTNSAAKGASDVAKKREAQTQAAVSQSGTGQMQAKGATLGGEVRFVVTPVSKVEPTSLARVQQSIQAIIGGLLDCRRRAGKGNVSTEGDLTASIALSAGGSHRTEIGSSTVASEKAPQCVLKVLNKAAYPKDTGAGQYKAVIHFTPLAPDDGAAMPSKAPPAPAKTAPPPKAG